MSNDTLKKVKDDASRAKLEGLQESVYVLDEGILKIKEGIKEKRGALFVVSELAQRVMLECNVHNQKVDKEEMSPEEAKIRISEITKIVGIIKAQGISVQGDLANLTGQIVGLEKGVANISKKFDSELAKYQRWERMQDSADGDVDELGRPIKTKSAKDKTEDKPEEKPAEKIMKLQPPKRAKKAPKKAKKKE